MLRFAFVLLAGVCVCVCVEDRWKKEEQVVVETFFFIPERQIFARRTSTRLWWRPRTNQRMQHTSVRFTPSQPPSPIDSRHHNYSSPIPSLAPSPPRNGIRTDTHAHGTTTIHSPSSIHLFIHIPPTMERRGVAQISAPIRSSTRLARV